MSRVVRLIVLTMGLMSVLAALTSSAGAVTWHNTGDTAWTASGTAGTLAVTGVSLTCPGASATGTSPGGSVVGSTYTAAESTLTYNGCTVSGIPSSIHCRVTLTGSSFTVATQTIHGSADVNCRMTQFGAEICIIEGQAPSSYVNPVSPSTFGRVIVSHSTTLRTTNGAAGSCPLGVGEPTTLTTQTFTITNATGGPTPHLGPRINRTA